MANKRLMAERQAKLRAEQEKKQKQKKTAMWISISVSILAALLIVVGVVIAVIPKPGEFNKNKTYYADITVKDYGKITVKLDAKTAPITVENFVTLAESGFYDGLTFHRIMEGFMMQGGDPEGTGLGGNVDKNGKKITIKGEFAENGVPNNISHVRGVISMARGGNSYDSASSQFFIVHEDSVFLDKKYAAFGHVISGIEVVDKVCEDAEPTDDNGTIKKEDQPIIESIVIRTE